VPARDLDHRRAAMILDRYIFRVVASATLAAWIATHDYQLIGDQPWREQFLTTTDTNTTIAEVQIPVHRRSTLGDTRRVLRSLR
ncbi:MAG TPA: hypothetical protein PK954_12680, partial [Anaerolineales bacterium]|nr:hypothetical protein [Anaerolineales bacterium]